METNTDENTTQTEISLKDIRETLYHCRDFEITNLWQRSVFLFAFLLVCFTGYGILFPKIIENTSAFSDTYIAQNFTLFFIAMIGIILSIIWIMMAKGSKAWYEVYEHAVVNIENKKELHIPKEFIMGIFKQRR